MANLLHHNILGGEDDGKKKFYQLSGKLGYKSSLLIIKGACLNTNA